MGFFAGLFGKGQPKPTVSAPPPVSFDAHDCYNSDPHYLEARVEWLKEGVNENVRPIANRPPKLLSLLSEFVSSSRVVTLACHKNGTTSVYYNNGGSNLDLGDKPLVDVAATALLNKCDELLSEMKPAESFSLPRAGKVRFYAITTTGILMAEGDEREFRQNIGRLLPLWKAVQSVANEIRASASK
jgi:hypothetical protein